MPRSIRVVCASAPPKFTVRVEKLPEVAESLVIGQDWEADVRLVLFVKLQEGVDLDDTLVARIKRTIREGATPRHVPAKVLQVTDIPRTRSGKIVELAVRNVVHGQPVRNIEALANPEALTSFADRSELRVSTFLLLCVIPSSERETCSNRGGVEPTDHRHQPVDGVSIQLVESSIQAALTSLHATLFRYR